MSQPQQFVQKLRNYCNIVRDDSLSRGTAEVEWRFSLVKELEAVGTLTPNLND